MHEYSIVQALLDQCESHAAANGATKVLKVVTKIGILSGVEPHLLEVAFDTFKEGTICEGAQFDMRIQPLVVECNECGGQSTYEKASYYCTHCRSNNVRVVEGEEMYLMQLELE